MSEVDLRKNYFQPPGYHLDSIQCLSVLFNLLSIFSSSKSITKLKKYGNKNGSIFYIFRTLELNKTSEYLISSAAIIRNSYENSTDESLFDGTIKFNNVGEFLEGFQGKNINLSLREACNKILHANYINYSSSEKSIFDGFLLPEIFLYGEREEVQWKVRIDIMKYCIEAFKIF